MKKYLREFDKLVGIFTTLRSKAGCLWDREQTHETLLKHLFLEAKEVEQAIKSKDMKNLEEELGDILLQVVFHAQIAKDDGYFSISGVIEKLNEKLIRRHPHVFGNCKAESTKDVDAIWEKVKEEERSLKKELKNKK